MKSQEEQNVKLFRGYNQNYVRKESYELLFPFAFLTASEKEDAVSVLRYLEAYSPSDSFLRLSLESIENTYLGTLQVRSSQGIFEAEYQGSSLYDTLYHLRLQIENDLERWKRIRELGDSSLDLAM